MMMDCASCRDAFAPDKDSNKLARDLESNFPNCACEAFSVGIGSPGRVIDSEPLYRLFVGPIDVDASTGDIARKAFRSAHSNGLSTFRECASDANIESIVIDCLTRKPNKDVKTVGALLRASCVDLRNICEVRLNENPKMFCVYDQTVPRKIDSALPHVPTHATVFFRWLRPANIVNRHLENDCEGKLYEVFITERVDITTFRGGLIAELNERSLNGEFVSFGPS